MHALALGMSGGVLTAATAGYLAWWVMPDDVRGALRRWWDGMR